MTLQECGVNYEVTCADEACSLSIIYDTIDARYWVTVTKRKWIFNETETHSFKKLSEINDKYGLQVKGCDIENSWEVIDAPPKIQNGFQKRRRRKNRKWSLRSS